MIKEIVIIWCQLYILNAKLENETKNGPNLFYDASSIVKKYGNLDNSQIQNVTKDDAIDKYLIIHVGGDDEEAINAHIDTPVVNKDFTERTSNLEEAKETDNGATNESYLRLVPDHANARQTRAAKNDNFKNDSSLITNEEDYNDHTEDKLEPISNSFPYIGAETEEKEDGIDYTDDKLTPIPNSFPYLAEKEEKEDGNDYTDDKLLPIPNSFPYLAEKEEKEDGIDYTDDKLTPVPNYFPYLAETEDKEDGKSHIGQNKQCLTGYMTDLQNWVDKNGKLSPKIDSKHIIDVSFSMDPVTALHQKINNYRQESTIKDIRYLSLAKCGLKRVPAVFTLKDGRGKPLHSMVEYLTFYENHFVTMNDPGEYYEEFINATDAHTFQDMTFKWPETADWATGFLKVTLEKLKELDLRKCSIQQLPSHIFQNMPTLEALYLGENQLSIMSANTFHGLNNLLHLDLSRNLEETLIFENMKVFAPLTNLTSLDLSWTRIQQRDANIFSYLGNKLQRLSICFSGLAHLPIDVFKDTTVKYLDLSGNNGIFANSGVLDGLQDKLQVLYAKKVGLKTFDIFYKFKKLEILDLQSNEINSVDRAITKSLENMQVLNLASNRLTTWFEIFCAMKELKVLSLRDNMINLVSIEMIKDMQNITYVGLAGNFIVCNCQAREIFEVAYRNQNRTKGGKIQPKYKMKSPFDYHMGFDDYNNLISKRNAITRVCDKDYCSNDEDIDAEGKFTFFDYDPAMYECSLLAETTSTSLSNIHTCPQIQREIDYDEMIKNSRKMLLFLIMIPAILFPVLIFFYMFRRNLKYFCITMRNSATLSLINKDNVVDDDTIFNYDVFVSYCNEDRDWVLDHLLPHVEKGCNVRVCLHERDFQVGLSILENIVSCMDRSRSIMLVISQQFLLSQWCQFEMHLAQHRLLETRREDLILVLLEEIPRRMRPTTLQYLMLTKTYIVWPKKESEYAVFWRRLTRSLLARGQNSQERTSWA